jgi:hypothetical protein
MSEPEHQYREQAADGEEPRELGDVESAGDRAATIGEIRREEQEADAEGVLDDEQQAD